MRKTLRKTLKFLYVIQEKKEVWPSGLWKTKRRLNPFNPFSYIVLIFTLIIGILMFGFVGVWEETDSNPFKWN